MIAPRYLVNYSAGACSWASAMRIIERHGKDGIVLLFADTQIEDADAYRFLDETAEKMGVPLVKIADGRDIWEVFTDVRFIGNSRVDPCSKILKRQLMDKWRDENCSKESTTLVVGLDWSERGRIEGDGNKKKGHRRRMEEIGWKVEYPMNERPYLTKDEVFAWMRSEGIEPPGLYADGFGHNNCGGFCVKMGLAQARHLLLNRPDTYLYHERKEAETMAAIGPTAMPFLCFRQGGKKRPVTMRKFREIMERQPLLFADQVVGTGCGGACAISDDD